MASDRCCNIFRALSGSWGSSRWVLVADQHACRNWRDGVAIKDRSVFPLWALILAVVSMNLKHSSPGKQPEVNPLRRRCLAPDYFCRWIPGLMKARNLRWMEAHESESRWTIISAEPHALPDPPTRRPWRHGSAKHWRSVSGQLGFAAHWNVALLNHSEEHGRDPCFPCHWSPTLLKTSQESTNQ